MSHLTATHTTTSSSSSSVSDAQSTACAPAETVERGWPPFRRTSMHTVDSVCLLFVFRQAAVLKARPPYAAVGKQPRLAAASGRPTCLLLLLHQVHCPVAVCDCVVPLLQAQVCLRPVGVGGQLSGLQGNAQGVALNRVCSVARPGYGTRSRQGQQCAWKKA